MSTDERELRRALEDTQAALRKERDAARQLRQNNAALDERLRELKERELDLEHQLAQSKRQLEAPPPAPRVVYVSKPATPAAPEEVGGGPWWFFGGAFGVIAVAVGGRVLWERYDTPAWEWRDTRTLIPLVAAGLVVLAGSVFGAVRAFRLRSGGEVPWSFFVGVAGCYCAARAFELLQAGFPLESAAGWGASGFALLALAVYLAIRARR